MEELGLEAIRLWQMLYDQILDDPYVISCHYDTDYCCFLCGETSPNHDDDCLWPRIIKLIKESKGNKLEE